jgi:septum formation protein
MTQAMSSQPVLTLASKSHARRSLLSGAGLEFDARTAPVDEEAVKLSLRAEGLSGFEQADALAEMKAVKVSAKTPGLVIGADQMLILEDAVFDKPDGLEGARAHLLALRGKTHTLATACVIADAGRPIWRVMTLPKLTMRNFSDAFLDAYLEQVGEAVCSSVGAYQLEGLGAQLFSRIEGDYFSILGLPLLELLDFLRTRGIAQR